MSTFDFTGLNTADVVNPTEPLQGSWLHKYSCVAYATLDLTALNSTTNITLGTGTVGPTILNTTDIYKLLAIPADTLVQVVAIAVVTPAVGTAFTFSVYDSGGTNTFISAFDCTQAAGTTTLSVLGTGGILVAVNSGVFYSSANYIALKAATVTSVTAGPKVKIFALNSPFA